VENGVRTTERSRTTATLGSPRADDAVRDDAMGLLAAGHNATLTYGPDGERRGEGMRVFVWAFAPKPRLLVFGAIDFAAAVARVGAFLGYHVTVCDARAVFATNSRFPEADEVVVDWPHRYLAAEHEAGRIDPRTVVTVLTHDPKFDVPLLEVALRLPEVAYVGAMGSRRTHDDRVARLREAGLTDEELARLSSPIGLDLGARTPEETAISIAAEIIAGRWGGSGERLASTGGRIHGATNPLA
jgi:xanthine dehydrogenase accessory factor